MSAMPPAAFYDSLIAQIEESQQQVPGEQATFFNDRPMSEHELVEFLSFQAYYERRAAEFIGRWLSETPELDAFGLLARQVEDEARHYEIHMKSLSRRGVTSLDNWKMEPEWEEWIDIWYPSGKDTLERLAAHNVTGELGAYTAFLEVKPRLPADVSKSFDIILPDEQFHMKLGRKVIETYCITEDQQERVRARVMHTLELQQHAREAFNRRMVHEGEADPGDPAPDLG